MKVDRGIPSRLAEVPAAAAALDRQGYDGCWTGEINHDPFLPMLLAAEHSTRAQLGTSIAVAFARNPMTVANLGWDLQDYSQGRFILGLGTQIAPHIERRFSMPWSRPVARMREFIAALQAIWSCWHDGGRLSFEGDFYTHTLMTPMFVPEPSDQPPPPVYVSAVGAQMTEMCGQAADGILLHAFTTRRYLDEVTLPALQRGVDRAGRRRADVAVSAPVFVVTGDTDEQIRAAAVGTRRQIAFYGSTPAYRPVLELHGWGELAGELHTLSRQGRWDAMGTLIDDDVLNEFAVVAPLSELAVAVRKRCDGAVDRVLAGLPADTPAETVTEFLDELRGGTAGGAPASRVPTLPQEA